MKEEIKGRIVSAIGIGYSLLGTKIGEWYEKNPYHKFRPGDVLILRGHFAGYGIRPVGVVNGYQWLSESRRYVYDVTMHKDASGNWHTWVDTNEVPQGVERIVSEHEIHFKWNIEHQFKRVHVGTVDEAHALYASREVEQKKVV